MRSTLLLLVACVFATLAACAPTQASGPYEPCNPALPCADPLVCQTPGVTRDGAPRQLCTATCMRDTDCPLPSGAGIPRVCALMPGGSAGTCLAYCATDADCLPGTLCRVATLASGEETRVCVP